MAMDQHGETMKNQIEALLRVISVARTYREDKVPNQIEEGLYLGSIGAANNRNILKSFNITHILTVAGSLRPSHPNDFVYKIVPAKKQGGGVLVHCFVGRSRSVTVVVAYLMKKHGMTLSQALQHVKSKRPVASPNAGFIKQLEELEKLLLGKQ
ncbi:PREDICTED: dual specificity protein phosphatase 1 isoform X2 [Tarenaya hassleriana]|uniref:dual specificity protein phosphatase 1 isoform X2 n=1 Tax=Tarenaya hassleriana TaxID=28532 RepID=UPI00053C115F|nr:PREDICTED: dual specificity protein phosphatase 1 isoform X2 [Tarenaya hassleriana]